MQIRTWTISAPAARRLRRRQAEQVIKALPFVAPWIVGFVTLIIYPVVSSFYYGLTIYDVVRPARFVGLENYRQIFTVDSTFRIALGNTLFLAVFGVPASMVSAFLIANLLNCKIRGRSVWRTIFFIPSIVPTVASVMIWLWIYNTQYGLLSAFFQILHMRAIPFLGDPELAKPALIIVQMWAEGTAIVIFLAALQDVPRELYEAAMIDGAGPLGRLLHITIPMCTPAILFILVTHLISTFQSFVLPFLLTNGGPNQATELYGVYVFRSAFLFFKMGYASALSWILFVIIIVFSAVNFLLSGRWVYYAA